MPDLNKNNLSNDKEQELMGDWHWYPDKDYIVSASEIFEFLKKKQIQSFFKPSFEQWVKNYFEKFFFSLYKSLDSLSERQSHFLIEPSEFYKPLKAVITYLKEAGLVKDYHFGARFNDAPAFYQLDIMPNFPRGVTDGSCPPDAFGHGFSRDFKTAFSKAIGEFLERYAGALYLRKNFLRGSFNDLKFKNYSAVNPDSFAGFTDWQKSYFTKYQSDKDSLFYWTKIKRFSTNEDVYVPAQLIFWNYFLEKDEPCLREFNSNGLGGWFNQEGAILSGLYELIQRDIFLIYWLNRLIPTKIDPRSIPDDKFRHLLTLSERYNFEIHCLYLASDIGVPVFTVVIEDLSGHFPKYTLGAGCYADPIKSLYRALEEAWSVYHWIRPYEPLKTLDSSYQPFKENIMQVERLRLWSNPQMADRFHFFLAGSTIPFKDLKFDFSKNLSSQKEELKKLVERVESMGPGYEIFYYHPNHPVLSSLSFCSVAVLVPQLVPLYLNETYVPLGATRLKEVPAKIGFKAAEKFNPWPHPFP